MTMTIHGKILGKTIELDQDPDVDEGQEVEIRIKVISKPGSKTDQGFRRTEGTLAEDGEWDAIMKQENFDQLVASIRQSGAIRHREMKPSRVTQFTDDVKAIRLASVSLSRNSPC